MLATSGGLSLAALPAIAQQATKPARIGFVYFGSRQPGPGAERYAAFIEGMRELGYVEGKNLRIEARFADSDADRLPRIVKEILDLKVDVIVATASPTYRVLQRFNTTLPVVVTVTADPVLERLAASVARPGGLFTGLSDTAADLSAKQLELLRTASPRMSRVGALLNPTNASHPLQATRLILAAQKMGLTVVLAEAGAIADIEPGFGSLATQRAEAVVLFGDTFFAQQMRELADAALRHRMASIYILEQFAELGGLMSYGASIVENFRLAATYVDKILKGAAPGDLPFEQPSRYTLAINLKTAKALGITVAQSLLQRADRVIQA